MNKLQAQQRAERLYSEVKTDSPLDAVQRIAAELLAVQRETKLEMIEWYRVHGDDTDDPRYAIREGQHE